MKWQKNYSGEKNHKISFKIHSQNFLKASVKMSEINWKRKQELCFELNFFPQTSAEALTFQPEFAEPIVNISVAIGRDATFTCHVRHLGGYRVKYYFNYHQN